ncbi:hypothetical protein AGMMS49957_12110 [Synergistales bacterium]|nr:hypothetical protein AGMMS49957_12110 [Synergistales bacterium]
MQALNTNDALPPVFRAKLQPPDARLADAPEKFGMKAPQKF